MKNLIFVCGTMGVGKTAACQRLKTLLPHCAFLDGDWCWDMSPFAVTDETKSMVLDNITHVLKNFIRCSVYENIVFCWVMHEQTIIDEILSRLDTQQCTVRLFSLVCRETTLQQRIEKDIAAGKRSPEVLSRSLARLPLYRKLHAQQIDTSDLSVFQTAALLLTLCDSDNQTSKEPAVFMRRYTAADCAQIVQLFHDTVHTVNAKDYSPAQLHAWAPENPDYVRWNNLLTSHYTLVALVDGLPVGFADLDSDYLDHLYVHKDYQRIGIATALTDALESYAAENGFQSITTHASLTAKPFFETRGYCVCKQQQVERNSIILTNFVMKKSL